MGSTDLGSPAGGASVEGWAQRWPLCLSPPLAFYGRGVSLLHSPGPAGSANVLWGRRRRGVGAGGAGRGCPSRKPAPFSAVSNPRRSLGRSPPSFRPRVHAPAWARRPAVLEQKDRRSISSPSPAVASAGSRGCFDLQCVELGERASMALGAGPAARGDAASALFCSRQAIPANGRPCAPRTGLGGRVPRP